MSHGVLSLVFVAQTPYEYMLEGELEDGEKFGLAHADPPYHIAPLLVRPLGMHAVSDHETDGIDNLDIFFQCVVSAVCDM